MASNWIWNVYLEEADSDDEKRLIGQIEALYEGEALKLAEQYYEKPSYDLVVKRSDLDKTE